MGKYMREIVEKALGDPEHHYRFAARLNWIGQTLEPQDLAALNHYPVYVGDENNETNEKDYTGIQKSTLQGYFLKKYDSGACEDFVLIGLQHPAKQNSRWGLEMFCKALIFGTVIRGAFYHVVEANDLKNPHGSRKTD